ncbi:MAG: hypothetical protein JW888_14025 [Pirellulales bacterium]|nr:hypothetical protein [Pirellulales bacterium]
MWLIRLLFYLVIPAIFMFFFALCVEDRHGGPGVFVLGMIVAFVAAGIIETIYDRLSELREKIVRLEDELKAWREETNR